MLKNMTIRSRLILTIGFLVSLLVAIGFLGLAGIASTKEGLRTSYEDHTVAVGHLDQVIRAILRARIANVLAIAEGDPETLRNSIGQIERDLAIVDKEWAAYIATNLASEEEVLAENFIGAYQKLLQEGLVPGTEALRRGDVTAAKGILETRIVPLHEPMREHLDALIKLELMEAEKEYDASVKRYETTRMITLTSIVVGIALALGMGYLLLQAILRPLNQALGVAGKIAGGDLSVRIPIASENELGSLVRALNQMADSLQELVGKVQRSGIQVASSATEIAASVKEQQATSTEQAATTNEIAASAREISSTSKVLVKNMDEVAHVADSTSELAESGREDLVRMEATMNQMMEATRGIASRLAVLSEKAGNIGSVVTTINKVADQTNLLSLNAAIEAEKAGEHGIGFGVVATEIRRLADQTAVSTWDIEQMVKEMQSAVSSGVMGVEKFSEEVRHSVEQAREVGERLSKIVKSVQQLTPHFESVFEAMQAQSAGAEQINEALEQLSQTVQGTAEAMRESALVVDQLNEASQRLQASVSSFKVMA